MIVVRDAIREDAAALGALHARTWRESYWGLLPDHLVARETAWDREEWWRSRLMRMRSGPELKDESVALGFERDGAPLGFVWTGPSRHREAEWDGEIYMLYVLNTAQRQGLGRRLMAEAARRLVGRGFFRIGLWVLEDNGPARAFYETLGGRFSGARSEPMARGAMPVAGYVWSDVSVLMQNALERD